MIIIKYTRTRKKEEPTITEVELYTSSLFRYLCM